MGIEDTKMEFHELIVIGGGPAGLAAAAAAYDTGITDTLILEEGSELGGSLLNAADQGACGELIFKKKLSVEEYLKRFLNLVEIYEVPYHTDIHVDEITLPGTDDRFSLNCMTAGTMPGKMQCIAVIVATGDISKVKFPEVKVRPGTGLPEINSGFGTSIQGLFVAGDIIRKHRTPDEASMEGAKAGRSAVEYILRQKEREE